MILGYLTNVLLLTIIYTYWAFPHQPLQFLSFSRYQIQEHLWNPFKFVIIVSFLVQKNGLLIFIGEVCFSQVETTKNLDEPFKVINPMIPWYTNMPQHQSQHLQHRLFSRNFYLDKRENDTEESAAPWWTFGVHPT